MVVFTCWADEVVDNRGKAETVPPERLKLPEEFRPGVPLKGFMGWDGFAIQDLGVEIVDMCRAWMEAAQRYSCGKCFPCRVGTGVIAEILKRLCEGRGEVEDLTEMEVLAQAIRDSSKCGIGQTAPIPLLKALEHYRDRFLEVVRTKERVPRGDYVVKLTAPCLDVCPANLDIPAYVELVREGRFKESLRVIREGVCLPGTLGRVCVRPCESHCRRTLVDQAVGHVERKGHFVNASGRIQEVAAVLKASEGAVTVEAFARGSASRLGKESKVPRDPSEQVRSRFPLYKGEFRWDEGEVQGTPKAVSLPEEGPEGEFPHRLMVEGLFFNHHVGWSQELRDGGFAHVVPEGYLAVNPADAEAVGVKDVAKVVTPYGEAEVRVRVTPEVLPGGLCLVVGLDPMVGTALVGAEGEIPPYGFIEARLERA